MIDQQNLQEFLLQLPPLPDTADSHPGFTPLCGKRTRLSTFFSLPNRNPTYLEHVSDAAGVIICTKCNPPVYYEDKMVALNKDPHWKEEVWLKRLRPWNADFVDPVVFHHLTDDQQQAVQENGLQPANNRA